MKIKFEKLKKLKNYCKKYFWLWIAYQCIKGMMTMSFIWIPLIWATFFRK